MEKGQASSFYQHFDENERPTVDYLVGLFSQFLFKNEPILADFLNPRKQYIFRETVDGHAQLYNFGGFSSAEKKRSFLCNWTQACGPSMFKITLFEIAYPHEWAKLTYSQILGILTYLGIKLDTLGDITNGENETQQFFVRTELKSYFPGQVTRVGGTKVRLHGFPLSEVLV